MAKGVFLFAYSLDGIGLFGDNEGGAFLALACFSLREARLFYCKGEKPWQTKRPANVHPAEKLQGGGRWMNQIRGSQLAKQPQERFFSAQLDLSVAHSARRAQRITAETADSETTTNQTRRRTL